MDFQTPLCGCFSDCGNCIYTCCCPTCAMSRNWATIRGEVQTCDHGCFTPSHYWTRQEIRKRMHYKSDGCGDCCNSYCCPLLSIIQEGAEIKLCPPPKTDYYFGQGPSQPEQSAPVINIDLNHNAPPPGYAAPPPGYAAPPPGYAPPPPGYAAPPPGYAAPPPGYAAPPPGYAAPPPPGYGAPPPQQLSPEEQQKMEN